MMSGPGGAKRLLIVESCPALADGLVSVLSGREDVQLVAIASTFEEAARKFAEISPDVTIVDMDMPDEAGIKAIPALRSKRPDAVIIALVSYEWDAVALEAIRCGAAAFVAKDRIMLQLVDLIGGSAGK